MGNCFNPGKPGKSKEMEERDPPPPGRLHLSTVFKRANLNVEPKQVVAVCKFRNLK